MSPDVVRTAEDLGVWIIAAVAISVVLLQAILYIRLSFRTARKIGLERHKCIQGLRSGMISAIGPSIAVFIVMVGMMAVVGAPITWLRLSIIGSAPTELTAAQEGAKVCGQEFGSASYDMLGLACSWWAMGINGVGWLLFVGFFAHKLEYIREKVGRGDAKWLAVLSGAAMLGAFSFLNGKNILAGIEALRGTAAPANSPVKISILIATIVGAVTMVIFLKLAKRFTWLREYTLGLAMLLGMVAGMLVQKWGGN